MPRNTYVSKLQKKEGDEKYNKRMRDILEIRLRNILDSLVESNKMEGYNYFMLLANEWNWAAGFNGN
jgi:hypothetical protein